MMGWGGVYVTCYSALFGIEWGVGRDPALAQAQAPAEPPLFRLSQNVSVIAAINVFWSDVKEQDLFGLLPSSPKFKQPPACCAPTPLSLLFLHHIRLNQTCVDNEITKSVIKLYYAQTAAPHCRGSGCNSV